MCSFEIAHSLDVPLWSLLTHSYFWFWGLQWADDGKFILLFVHVWKTFLQNLDESINRPGYAIRSALLYKLPLICVTVNTSVLCTIKQLQDSFFVVSKIIKVSVGIDYQPRPEALIILDGISEIHENTCFPGFDDNLDFDYSGYHKNFNQ